MKTLYTFHFFPLLLLYPSLYVTDVSSERKLNSIVLYCLRSRVFDPEIRNESSQFNFWFCNFIPPSLFFFILLLLIIYKRDVPGPRVSNRKRIVKDNLLTFSLNIYVVRRRGEKVTTHPSIDP